MEDNKTMQVNSLGMEPFLQRLKDKKDVVEQIQDLINYMQEQDGEQVSTEVNEDE